MAMFPQTSAATAALSVAARFYSPALLNHCVRSYLWGTSYASAHGISFDDELYYVSALVHDVGLTDPFDSHRVPFEEAGGDVAWGVLAGMWPDGDPRSSRRRRERRSWRTTQSRIRYRIPGVLRRSGQTQAGQRRGRIDCQQWRRTHQGQSARRLGGASAATRVFRSRPRVASAESALVRCAQPHGRYPWYSTLPGVKSI
jgi:hypothetical protein